MVSPLYSFGAGRGRVLTTSSTLCNDYAIKLVEAPFVTEDEEAEDWTL